MRVGTFFLVVALGLVVSAGNVAGQSQTADPRVAEQLNRLGLHYTITTSGNYSIKYSLDNGRSQTVYIMGQTEKYQDTEIREMWSRAGTYDAVPPADVLQGLLEESGTKKIGFWSIEKDDAGGYIVYFSVRVPVYVKDSDLGALLGLTADTADQKESELFDVDEE
ncbi:MAG TPA: hypothetical protein VL354_21710 [Spirochaetia bacterium]|nr:hypothetical protein [Spirochaetia bacterium]